MKPLRNYGEREPNFSGIICFWMNLESYVVTFLASLCLVDLHIYLDSLILRRDFSYNLLIYRHFKSYHDFRWNAKIPHYTSTDCIYCISNGIWFSENILSNKEASRSKFLYYIYFILDWTNSKSLNQTQNTILFTESQREGF